MNDLWSIYNAPVWVAHAFMSRKLGGFQSQSPLGVLNVLWAVHPDQAKVVLTRMLLPESGMIARDEPIRTEEVHFAVDHEKRTWTARS